MTVDVLFPYYGDVALMKEAVRSVLRQSYGDFRLIVVDDGYPDDSIPGWFDSLGDSRISYERNEDQPRRERQLHEVPRQGDERAARGDGRRRRHAAEPSGVARRPGRAVPGGGRLPAGRVRHRPERRSVEHPRRAGEGLLPPEGY